MFEALEEQRLNCVSNLQSSLLEIETGRLVAEETVRHYSNNIIKVSII